MGVIAFLIFLSFIVVFIWKITDPTETDEKEGVRSGIREICEKYKSYPEILEVTYCKILYSNTCRYWEIILTFKDTRDNRLYDLYRCKWVDFSTKETPTKDSWSFSSKGVDEVKTRYNYKECVYFVNNVVETNLDYFKEFSSKHKCS